MKKLNKIILSLIALLGMVMFPIKSNASSGSLSISGTTTAVIGNTVTINVTLSSSQPIGAWEFDVNYDTSYLKLTSSNAENNGTYFVNAGNGSMKSKTYTLKFRALKSGSTNITIGSYDVYAYDTSRMSITKSNKKVTIMTQQELEASYSKDNYLKTLSVEGFELDKAFDKETTEYTVNVPTGTTSVKINASVNDSRSSVSGTGEIEVSEGLNTLPIVVTAQNGSEKTYTLIVNVEDQNPIEVKVDNENYTVVKNENLLTAPGTFTETKIIINDIEVPGFVNEKANITLVGLKNSDGTISLFIYDNGEYSKFNEMNLAGLLLIPVPLEKELDFTKGKVNINGEEIECYKYSDKSDFAIISAKSLVDGKTDLYLYDTENNTAIRYDEELASVSKDTLKLYTYIIIAFASTSALMLIIIMCLLHSSKKKQKKINKFIEKQEAKIEATRKLNDVVSEVQKITAKEKEIKKEEKSSKISLEETKKIEQVKEDVKKENKTEKTSEYDNADLTGILDTLGKEQLEATKKLEIDKNELSKKELKELKKLEKKKAKEKKKNRNKDDEVNIKEIDINKSKENNVSEDTEEVYDLFGDD